jgi:hypothetical protein
VLQQEGPHRLKERLAAHHVHSTAWGRQLLTCVTQPPGRTRNGSMSHGHKCVAYMFGHSEAISLLMALSPRHTETHKAASAAPCHRGCNDDFLPFPRD